MSKSTLSLIVIATLILGALIAVAVIGNDAPPVEVTGSPPDQDVGAAADGSGIVFRLVPPGSLETKYDQFGSPVPTLDGDNFLDGRRAFRKDTLRIEIPGDGAIEYKALMERGDSLVFDWAVEGGQVYYDMHAHDPAFGDEFFTRYEEGDGTGASGTIIAPYSGQHGWYWLNLEANPVAITLEVAGFYEDIIKIDMGEED